jgi:hypothetical protein
VVHPSAEAYVGGWSAGSIGRSSDGPASEGAVALGLTNPEAAAARAARVFLFLQPGGRPRREANEGMAATAIAAFFPLPRGRPGLRFSGTPPPPACLAPGPPMVEIAGLCPK